MDVQFQRVQPGDVITSDLFNLLLAEFAKLRDRVTVLEGTPSVGDVAITNLLPNLGIVRVAERLTVVGYGFGLSLGACQAFIDTVPVTQFLSGSSDEQLIFILPDTSAVIPIPPVGRAGTVVVRGPRGQARRDLTILPAKVAPPGGVGVQLTFKSVSPITVTAGQACAVSVHRHLGRVGAAVAGADGLVPGAGDPQAVAGRGVVRPVGRRHPVARRAPHAPAG